MTPDEIKTLESTLKKIIRLAQYGLVCEPVEMGRAFKRAHDLAAEALDNLRQRPVPPGESALPLPKA